jgi:hypothetical protein
MFAKKPPTSTRNLDFKEQLDYLYTRRSTIDLLIESLEEYDRYQHSGPQSRERKTA